MSDWRVRLREALPLMGHRNWIVVADAAYPWQSAEWIETIWTDEEHRAVLSIVMDSVGKSPHVRPTVFVDRELRSVSGGEEVWKALASFSIEERPHDEIIREMNEAAKLYRVLVLKTKQLVAYTSVFFRLECGYWSEVQERGLRDRLDRE